VRRVRLKCVVGLRLGCGQPDSACPSSISGALLNHVSGSQRFTIQIDNGPEFSTPLKADAASGGIEMNTPHPVIDPVQFNKVGSGTQNVFTRFRNVNLSILQLLVTSNQCEQRTGKRRVSKATKEFAPLSEFVNVDRAPGLHPATRPTAYAHSARAANLPAPGEPGPECR